MTENQKTIQRSAIRHVRACLDCLEGHIENNDAVAVEWFAGVINQQARFIKDSLEMVDAPQK